MAEEDLKTAHLCGVSLESGKPAIRVEFKGDQDFIGQYRKNEVVNFGIDELKAFIFELTKALHTGELVRDHSANCEKCALDALGQKKP